MRSPREAVRAMRLAAGISQRQLARRAGTSQSAIARYELGAATPSWETMRRIGSACGRDLRIEMGTALDPGDVELAQSLLELSPLERLRTLSRYARLRDLAEDAGPG